MIFPLYEKPIKVMPMTLAELCKRYYERKPNLMSLDIEGVGHTALESNNW